ncbi:hypothetical protein GCM10009347_01960 [Shewanella algicola]|uniref:Uncharacterized protein n=1 Tax=Shewanella algicola TaxID=640633 RepID=A0A9X1Z2Y3_9GAMM|nr:hypothetical protein [Shewanella algicola]MCL1103702.1 hypothetical protein [Shewanella algicola]GGP37602.1 hypothetical protein GCM10009347_01960 [Shewanella algicola]
MNKQIPAFLSAMSKQMHEQSNRCTAEPTPHRNDIRIGAGVIVAHKMGCMLPGGKYTENPAEAIRAAKGIHRLTCKR